ncbi:pilus assembly protein TadG-related protein [Micrococcus luteus]|uniref:pilus assembly protein TadG-related protein n=1 Tax=Micrococcus luteus TaxID=1270 RepID=UPI001F292444|nr:pilus assembly protein TadG-related protein [Micrococcus luteus]
MLAVTTVQLQHRRLQSLADSAAIAGAEELGFRLGRTRASCSPTTTSPPPPARTSQPSAPARPSPGSAG